MKKILLLLILTMSSTYAKPCMTDIYFGNGVWNEEDDAKDGIKALRYLMFSSPNSRLNKSLEGQEYDFKYAHNPTNGTIDDLVETFYQLKESGQISDGYFMGVYAALAAESNGETFIAKLRDIISKYNSDANAMFSLYKQSSFNQKHNVILVAHSQGNLFGNKMYTLMNDAQKKKFRMVSVATPADHVAGGGPYVTATGDYVIRPIPGSLPSNIAGFGHTFIGTYLNLGGGAAGDGSKNSPKLIAQSIKSAHLNLIDTNPCSKYDFIHIGFGRSPYSISVIANVSGTNQNYELIGTLPVTCVRVITGKCHDNNYVPYGASDDFYPTYSQNALLDFRWNVGSIGSIEELEKKKGSTLDYFRNYQCCTVSLTKELYNLAESAFTGSKTNIDSTDVGHIYKN